MALSEAKRHLKPCRRTVSSGSAHSDNEDVPEKQMALDRQRAVHPTLPSWGFTKIGGDP